MSEANNTEVNGGTSEIEAGAFGGAVTFDDLDSIGEDSKKSPEEKAEKPAKSEKDGEITEKKPASEKKPDEKQDKGQGAEKKEAKEGDKDKAATGEKPKVLKFKNGDADLDVPANAKVTVKIEGKDEVFEVQDLINEFSGKTNWGRKFQELDTERKSFHAERDELNGSIDTLYKLAVTENKPLEAVQYLSDLLGGDGIKTVLDLQKQMLAQLAEEAKLTPEQLEAKQAKQRADLLQKKFDNQKQTDAKKTEQAEIAKRVEAVKTQHSIDDKRFSEVYKALKESGVKESDLTPELVGDVHQRWHRMDEVDEIAKELQIEDQNSVKKLYTEYLKDLSLTKAEIKAIAQQVFGSKKSSLKEKIDRNNGGENKPAAKQTKQNNEALFFDDL